MDAHVNSPALASSKFIQGTLGIGSTTLHKFVAEGKLNPIRFSRRLVRYRLSEVQALIDAHAASRGKGAV